MSSALVELAKELSAPLGRVTFRRMFSGWGVFCEAGMFGLVADDVLYLKVDSETRAVFEAEGLEPFGYQSSRARRIVLPNTKGLVL
jgi:DNA transformation protein